MLSLFGPRLPIDRDEYEFQLAAFKWLGERFGPAGQGPLVLPTPDFFSAEALRGKAPVPILFERVRALAGMADWPCELVAGAADRPIDAGNALLLRHEGRSAPCGTFRIEAGIAGHHAVIAYNPAMARDPAGLVATFAHELAHYLLASVQALPPGGPDLVELNTDLAAVHLGFGLFLANSARSFSQFQSGGLAGWSARAQGYLSESALVTALAVRERLAGRDPMDAAPHLKSYLRGDLKRAARALAKQAPDMAAAVAAADLDDFA